ncbi:MAG: ATP-binding protein [Myxococcaceae bacterium]
MNGPSFATRPNMDLTDLLVDAAQLLGEQTSEQAVCAATYGFFSGLPLAVDFYTLKGQTLLPLWPGEQERSVDAATARAAVDSGRAVFFAHDDGCDVYLPIGVEREELLIIFNTRLSAGDVHVFSLFARQVAMALANARAISEYERRNVDLAAVAQVARLVAQPLPAPFDAVLLEIVAPLKASGVVLQMPDESGTALLPVAHCGLEPDAIAFLAHPTVKTELAARALLSSPVSTCDAAALPPGFKFGAAIRLIQGGKVLAILQALRHDGEPFDSASQELLQTFGDLLMSTIEQRRLQTESWRQLSETQLLLELARTTSGTLELSRILEVACDFLVKLLDVSNCFILLHDAATHSLQGAAASRHHRDLIRTVNVAMDHSSVVAGAARERRPVAIEDLTPERRTLEIPLATRLRQKAVLGLPMLTRDELIGVVLVDDTRGPRHFSEELIGLAEATLGQLALSVANARLYASLKESYAELADTRAQMVKRERLVALGELSAIVAHEVRNPLGVIFNAVSALRRQLPNEGDAAMLLEIVREESDRLDSIVGELLDFARPRALSLQPEDLQRVVQEAVDATPVRPGSSEHDVRFATQIEEGLPPVPMDQRLIRQALVNVLVNAAQAMPRGGQVTVSARREQRNGKALVRIDLVDEGTGIPPEIAFRIFEPFFTTKAKGTGLGLAVVKRILEDHQGEVEVNSSVGQGTTFTFRLPLRVESGRGEAL